MKILIDIGHPAHVHYFRNLIKNLQLQDHHVLVIAREKEVSQILLKKYGIDFFSRGRGKSGLIGKIIYLFTGSFTVYSQAKKFSPDLFMSAGSMYAAIASKLCGKPHVTLEDSENLEQIRIYKPFTDLIIYPKSCTADLGKKGIRIQGFLQSAYLVEDVFSPDPEIFNFLSIPQYANFFLLRFVALNATHDLKLSTTTLDDKKKLIRYLENFGKVFISSESPLPNELEKYAINIPPEKMHDVVYFASAVVGESGAMSNEAAFLGVPCYLLVDPNLGVHFGYRKLGLKKIYSGMTNEFFQDLENDLQELTKTRENSRKAASHLHQSSLALNNFLLWIVTNLPLSLSGGFIKQSVWKEYVQ